MRKISYIAIGFSAVTSLVGYGLTSIDIASAETNSVDDVSLTVLTACNITATDGSFAKAMDPGTYDPNFGSSAFSVSCNGTNDWSLYAIGDGEVEGLRNALVETSTHYIETGTATSGPTSNWAMKLNLGTNATAAMLQNGYGDFSVVPDTQTKVASVPASMGIAQTISFSTQYAVYVALGNGSGDFAGRVKYTLVYPASAPAPADNGGA